MAGLLFFGEGAYLQISEIQASVRFNRGYLIALAATLLLSFTGILISYLNRTYALPSLVLAFWRDLFVSVGMFIFLFMFKPALLQFHRLHRWFMIFYGLILAAFNSTWTFSVQYNGPAVATVLAYSSPAITALLSRWLFKEKINTLKVVSILLSLVGIVLIAEAFNRNAWEINPLGIIFGLLSGLFYALYSLFGKQAAEKSIAAWTTLLYSFSAATLFLFLFNLIAAAASGIDPCAQFFWLANAYAAWVVLLFLGLGPTIGGFGLYVMSLGYLPATVVNLIAALEPVFTAVWAYWILGETLSAAQLFGGSLILIGVILLRVRES